MVSDDILWRHLQSQLVYQLLQLNSTSGTSESHSHFLIHHHTLQVTLWSLWMAHLAPGRHLIKWFIKVHFWPSEGGIYFGWKRVIIDCLIHIQDEEKSVQLQWSSPETTYLVSNYKTICSWLLNEELHMVGVLGFWWSYEFVKYGYRWWRTSQAF